MDEQPITNKHELIAAIEKGLQPEYVFFWLVKNPIEDPISSECLSQWYPSPFVIEGIRYPAAEHYMMAEKARLFGDEEILQKILRTPDPAEAKKLGKQVKGFVEAIWKQHNFAIVVRGNDAKFGQDHLLKKFLLDTKEKILVEASPTDKVYGVKLKETDRRIHDPKLWQGYNDLGFALMVVRSRLAAQENGPG